MRDEATVKANFRILVFLYSNLQGLFAFHNIRLQLKHTRFSKYSLDAIKEQLSIVKKYLDIVKKGQSIFGESENNPSEKQAHAEINSLLQNLKLNLTDLAIELKSIIDDKEYFTVNDYVADIVAALSFKAYSRDNFARTHLEIEEELAKDNALQMFKELAEVTKLETKQVHTILNSLKKPEELNQDFFEYLRFFTRSTPALMNTNLHDINQFLAYGQEEFNFASADFDIAEEQSWKEAGFGAIEAGYWRACFFSIPESLEWSRFGFGEPIVAFEWKAAGFQSYQAALWASHGFSSYLAIQWISFGLHPEVCILLMNNGYQPLTLPKGDELIKLVNDLISKTQSR